MPTASSIARFPGTQPASKTASPVEQPELALAREPSRVQVPTELIRNRKDAAAAFTLACDASGLDDKEIYIPLGIDSGYFSNIKKGRATLQADKVEEFCRHVGNTIFVEWLAYRVGCALVLIRTEAERQRDEAVARAEEAERKLAFATELLRGRATA